MCGVEQEDRERASKGTLKRLKEVKKVVTQESFGSDKTRIENQVRLKAQL